MFTDDLEKVTDMVTNADIDLAEKKRLIHSVMAQIRSLKAAVNLNTHFLILSSILEDPVIKTEDK